jgi:hypothetical protein
MRRQHPGRFRWCNTVERERDFREKKSCLARRTVLLLGFTFNGAHER